MTQYADWINFMTYDLHGVWDRNDPIGSIVLAHTNLTEIDLALDLVRSTNTYLGAMLTITQLWRNNIDPAKVVMGET